MHGLSRAIQSPIAPIFLRSVRVARQEAYSEERLSYHATLQLAATMNAVFDCLRNLACLQHWWPHLQTLQALPGGLHGAGDVALLQLRSGSGLLRVLRFQPGRRMVLALAYDTRIVLLDVSVRESVDGRCVLALTLETPKPAAAIAHARRQQWLALLGSSAKHRLALHLCAGSAVLSAGLGD
jgi:hypothetical protein